MTDGTNDHLALSVVCDIRGFTSLQTRVHEFVYENVRHVSNGPTDKLSNAYKKYVEKTQNLAREELTKYLVGNDLGKNGFVVKSTGDGYLVAVPIQLDEDGSFSNSIPAIKEVVRAAYKLTVESELDREQQHTGKFASATKEFLAAYGNLIGFSVEHIQKEATNRKGDQDYFIDRNSRFRVAAGVSIGFATFLQDGNRKKEKQLLSDVSGYGVNLAFRLCDYAGRTGINGEDRSTPAILLDSRVGRALLEIDTEDINVVPFHEQISLAGISENWAYFVKNAKVDNP